MASQRPNILFVMADQLAPQYLRAYGHKVTRTPTIDALAASGVTFEGCYTNAPLCAPSRYVMMTGRLPTKIGAWDNACELSSEVPTFAHYLSALGYHTALAGKMHFCGPDQHHGFRERLTTDVYPSDFTWTPNWDEPAKPLDWYHTMDVVKNAGPCLRSSNIDYDDEVTFQSTRFLYDRARNKADEGPFCLTVSYINPHDPYIARPEYWDLYNDAEIDMPKLGLGDVEPDPFSRRLMNAIGMDRPAPTEAQIRAARRAYYASTSYVDAQLAKLLKALDEGGLRDNTLVLFTADHGDMLGERGLWYKMVWYENSARVPLIVSYPSAFKPARVSKAVAHVDFLPTLVDIATDGKGIGGYPTPLEGCSLLPHLSGSGGHDAAVGEYCAEGTEWPVFMIRRGQTKFVQSKTDPDQLYRLDADPLEQRNLADDPAEKETVAAFRAEAAKRWPDVDAIRSRILESQRRRLWLAPVMQKEGVAWDYAPTQDAKNLYIRNNLPIYEIERRSRFP
jgi:choline-sulfatase